MTPIRVDFYLLPTNDVNTVWLTACRLVEKAYLRGHRVFIFCDSQTDAHKIDELLWTFKEDSFIPHNLQGEGPEPPPAVQIGFSSEPRGYNDILLNLSKSIPSFTGRFKRIIEIVNGTEDAKEVSRQHYREYRSKQYNLHTHVL
ncbi:DNA polymerase III subunit chi (plasmid) [Legionella adelaidensis]|uniref:DNA polymerase III subunit chi n=1 Tax=Legionella adelaidensis TaxID=45056 RepID=A0A0W0R312_9GAMM|nr:DNA polymerase III subunit chi [Legionella adelaidensis]KTC65417.1 DNA polymerase III subunit chi [Legionella adelaidensis]VEH84761.1 DNA polymerase III subunit chi [Legionella adelaidensis]